MSTKKKKKQAPPRVKYMSIRMDEALFQLIEAEATAHSTFASSVVRNILRGHFSKGRRNAR